MIIAGASGSGKTTVGRMLASRLGWEFREGDDLHPPSNLGKMASGIPLDDRDRQPWLAAVADAIGRAIGAGTPLVISCSALKEEYRRRLLAGTEGVEVVFLSAGGRLLRERLRRRSPHFFGEDLLQSQLDILEEPRRGLVLDASCSPQRLVEKIQAHLRGRDPRHLDP